MHRQGKRWWQKADDPWQCLATCIELKAALTSENPLEYECSLPVHQDGTCNGLQHYAALGGDARGAAQVNLDVSERPSDVYTHVAQMVEASIAEDAARGDEWGLELKGKIGRKVVKQTVRHCPFYPRAHNLISPTGHDYRLWCHIRGSS